MIFDVCVTKVCVTLILSLSETHICQTVGCQRLDHYFFHVSVTVEHAALLSHCFRCFWLCCLFDRLPVSSSPSSHFLTFLFNALCILCWKCHYHTTDCPSPVLSPQTVSPLHALRLACQIMSVPVCSSPILTVFQPALSLSPHYRNQPPCLLFPCPPQTDTVALPAPFLSSPLRQRGAWHWNLILLNNSTDKVG